MLPVVDLRREPGRFAEAVARPNIARPDVLESVRSIIGEVRARGDDALCELTKRFDGVDLGPAQLRATRAELEDAWDSVGLDLQTALRMAARRVREYHSPPAPEYGAEPAKRLEHRYDSEGVVVTERHIPVGRAGVYVPGGRAQYPSTVLMTVVPAQVAGVTEVALCVPPGADGRLPPATAAAAHLLGLTEVYKIGGAQAVAAMAYGTRSISPVDVIVGPGNVYVALAKAEVARDVGVESLAGPSECVVVADEAAPADLVAIDLVAQAEHGPGGFALLVTWSEELGAAVGREMQRLVDASPRREEVVATLTDGGRVVLVPGPAEAMDVANAAAAEHLQLMVVAPDALVPLVRNAGAVFCGYDTPVTLGDYVAGPSHVLPTGGTARFASALRPADFQKSVHIVSATPDGLANLGPAAVTIADAEGLEAHAATIRLRLRKDDNWGDL